MMRFWKPLAGCALLMGSLFSCLVARADAPVINGAPTFTGTGVLFGPQAMQGVSACSLTNTGGSGNTAKIQTSNDGVSNWTDLVTATTGNTVTAGVGSSNTALLYMRVNVTIYGSGTGTAAFTCNGSVQGGSGGAGGTVAISPQPIQVSGSIGVNNFPSPYPTDTFSQLIANDQGQTTTKLTSASATSCTNLINGATFLYGMWNVGPVMTVFMTLYNEGTSPLCAAADVIWGDNATLVLGPGQFWSFGKGAYMSAGLSYKLSGALTSNLYFTSK